MQGGLGDPWLKYVPMDLIHSANLTSEKRLRHPLRSIGDKLANLGMKKTRWLVAKQSINFLREVENLKNRLN